MPKSAMAACVLLATGIHHAGLGQHVDHSAPRPLHGQLGTERVIAHRGHHGPLDHAIGQQFVGDPRDLASIEIALDQIAAGGGDGQILGDAQFGGRSGHFSSG